MKTIDAFISLLQNTISNVNDRIKLLYGDDYGVTITSELNIGTTVKVIIPAQKEFMES